MFTQTRKNQLLKDFLNLNDEAILLEIESMLKKSKSNTHEKIISAHAFSGLWSKKDSALIEKAIIEGCGK